MPPGYILDHYNSSLPFNPIATNGEPFPWFLPNLPNNVRPIRYTLTIHPNLTTFDVKGKPQKEHTKKKKKHWHFHINHSVAACMYAFCNMQISNSHFPIGFRMFFIFHRPSDDRVSRWKRDQFHCVAHSRSEYHRKGKFTGAIA